MEELRWFVTFASNVGGFGLMAFVLWRLHERALDAFRQELREERQIFRETLTTITEAREQQHEQALRHFATIEAALRAVLDQRGRGA